MKTIGFIISEKKDEKRRMILPEDLINVKNKKNIFIQTGYGLSIGVEDKKYIEAGINVCSKDEILKCDIIVDRKLGDANYIEKLKEPKILVGAAHAIQNLDFTTKILAGKHTVIATEEMFEDGKYIFYKNNVLAGEAGILQAITYSGRLPSDSKVAVLGQGNVALGVIRILSALGAEIDVYGRKHEQLFRKKFINYDIIVNCVKWDVSRKDRLIYKEDLKKMKPGALIVDISCDPHLEIETSHPTTISDPVFYIDGVGHYCVDNTPSIFPYTGTKILSEKFCYFLDDLITNNLNYDSDLLRSSIVIKNGIIVDKRISEFRSEHLK